MTTTEAVERQLPPNDAPEQVKRAFYLGSGRLISEVYRGPGGRLLRTHKMLGENGSFATPGPNPVDYIWWPAPTDPVELLRARKHFWYQMEMRLAPAWQHLDGAVNHGSPPVHWPEWLMGPALMDGRGNYLPGPDALRIVGDRLREAREQLAKIDAELNRLDADRRNRSNIRFTRPVSNIVMTDFDTPR